MSIIKPFIDEIVITSKDELNDIIEKCEGENKWIFRGQTNFDWGLETSIDRMFADAKLTVTKLNVEIALLKRFQREAHHYGITDIGYLNIPEWLCLMQHYGTPTRLLDWTHSPWVGLFFAIIDLKENQHAALWAADWKEIDSKSTTILKNLYKRDHNLMSINDFILTVSDDNGVVKLNSFKQNQRQIIQQGTFLFSTNIEKTFEENIEQNLNQKGLKKIKIPYSLKTFFIQKLYRMNISFTTLFPGIAGFSKSLGYLHHIDGILKLEDGINDYSGYKTKFRE